MKFDATEETLRKIKDLQEKEAILVNSKGEEARIGYVMSIKPYKPDHVTSGDIVTVITTDAEWTEYVYKGEEGLQQLLKEWKEK